MIKRLQAGPRMGQAVDAGNTVFILVPQTVPERRRLDNIKDVVLQRPFRRRQFRWVGFIDVARWRTSLRRAHNPAL